MKHVIIVNGPPLSGKDTFISYCKQYAIGMTEMNAISISSIDPVKMALRDLGWDGEKTDSARSMLSLLKRFWISNNDGPTAYLIRFIIDYEDNNSFIFVQIREPEEIKKLVNAMSALRPIGISISTVVVARYQCRRAYNNESDDNVFKYTYDYSIENKSTVMELREMAGNFMADILLNNGGKTNE